jgi:hypothetical protein
MRYYATKTFPLRRDDNNFDYFCSYCGNVADHSIESDDRDSIYHRFCSCPKGNEQKNLLDKIYHHQNEISKLRAKIHALPTSDRMIRAREYENKLRKLNEEYFPGGNNE